MSGKNETEEVLHKSLGGLAHPFAQPQTEAAHPKLALSGVERRFSKGGLPADAFFKSAHGAGADTFSFLRGSSGRKPPATSWHLIFCAVP